MGLTIKKNTARKKSSVVKGRKRVSPTSKTKLRDLNNDPYFVKKAESAKQLLDKYGTTSKLP